MSYNRDAYLMKSAHLQHQATIARRWFAVLATPCLVAIVYIAYWMASADGGGRIGALLIPGALMWLAFMAGRAYEHSELCAEFAKVINTLRGKRIIGERVGGEDAAS